jgi:hypothetical protein
MYAASQYFFFFKQIFNNFHLDWNQDLLYTFGDFLLKRVKIHPIIDQEIDGLDAKFHVYFARNFIFPEMCSKDEKFEFIYDLKLDRFDEVNIVVINELGYNKTVECFHSDLLTYEQPFFGITLREKENKVGGWKRALSAGAFFDTKVNPKYKTLKYTDETHTPHCNFKRDGIYSGCNYTVTKGPMSEQVFFAIFKQYMLDMGRGEDRNKVCGEKLSHFSQVYTTECRYKCTKK